MYIYIYKVHSVRCVMCVWFYVQDRLWMFLEQNKRRKFPSVPSRIVHARVHVRVISGSINSIKYSVFQSCRNRRRTKKLNHKSKVRLYNILYGILSSRNVELYTYCNSSYHWSIYLRSPCVQVCSDVHHFERASAFSLKKL